jgi:hypothetical protein
MASFFQSSGFDATDVGLHLAGGVSRPIVNTIYPMKALTEFHYAHHIKELTGRWMDTGAYVGGYVKGSFHRLAHGHHLFEDGFKVLINTKLKFGEFLHHLGLDFLTTRGIPNPLLPKILGQKLIELGLNRTFVYEFMTVNLPKVLSGSLGVVVSGIDVLMCFSDAIPHTFMAAGMSLGMGALDIAFGLFPPNFFLLAAGAAQIGVGITTVYRTIVDPILPIVNVPGSVFLPLLGQSILISSLIGACVGYFSGYGWENVPKSIVAASSAATASTLTSLAFAGSGFIGPFLGPVAAIATYLIVHKTWDKVIGNSFDRLDYKEYATNKDLSYFNKPQAFPILTRPKEPIGMLKGDRLLINEKALSEAEEGLAN